MLGRALSQRATQTLAKGPSATTSERVYTSSARGLFGQDNTNFVQSYRFAGSVKPAAQVPAAHETKKKPNRFQQKLPDLEIENALDDASWDSSAITKSSGEPTTEAVPGRAGAPAADILSASAVSIPETVALDHLIERMQPDYPEDAKAQHVQGTVMLDVVVGRDGQVESVSLVEGNARLLASAAEAVGKWRFTPLIRNGQSVRFKSHITLHFDLP
jgi:TonB family protein